MNHKHKSWFVASLLVLGAGCTVVASRLEPRISLGSLPSTPKIRVPTKRIGNEGIAVLPREIIPTTKPATPSIGDGPATFEEELAIKPISEHASEILRDGEYPQEAYVALATTPNDPYALQWPIVNIDTANGWDVTTGNSAVTIAVIDTGFGLQHEELADRWYVNPGESGPTTSGGRCWTGVVADKATNDCDDDNNGYDDDWRGWDFFWNDNDPTTGSVSPSGNSVAHGTEVASLAAASSNNNKGIAGMNWQAKIMPLQVLSDNGNGITNDVVAAIEYAARQGADVINLSLGSSVPDAALQAAVRFANSRNVTVVAAAGNCGASPPTTCNPLSEPGNMNYPALYDEVISVGALTLGNNRANFSSYGATLDVVAPGSAIPYSAGWSASNTTSLYANGISGTSFASPIVAGLAALVRGIDPSLGPKDIRAILTDSSDRVPGMGGQAWHAQYGFGRVNAYRALQLAQVRATAIKAGPAPTNSKKAPLVSLSEGTTAEMPVSLTTELIATCASYMGDNCTIEFTGIGNERYSLYAQKTGGAGTAGWRFTPESIGLSAGTWVVRAHGNSLSSESVMFYVQ